MFQRIQTQKIPISTQRYKDGGVTEKLVLDITDSVRRQKQEMITSDVSTIEFFLVRLRGQNIDTYFFYTRLPLNEDDKFLTNNRLISITRIR